LAAIATACAMHDDGSEEELTDASEDELGMTSSDLSRSSVIDADRQIAEATRAQAGRDGYWPDAPDPGDKAFAPETDLRAFPKFTEKDLAARLEKDLAARLATGPAGESSLVVDVITIQAFADGTRVTIYDPAPGVDPEELADNLRMAGASEVHIAYHEPGDQNILAPNDCAYGSARSLVCPVAFWHNNGLEDPLVRFNDHSSAAWPVSQAVPKWNQVPNIDSSYRFNACGAPAGARCVDVYSGNYGATTWVGLFSMFFPTEIPEGPLRENGQWIQLNDYYSPADRPFTRNNVATHEVGHALGMGHNVWSGDVMYYIANRREDIGGENPVFLQGLYSIAR
jgi:hypothetical protein